MLQLMVVDLCWLVTKIAQSRGRYHPTRVLLLPMVNHIGQACWAMRPWWNFESRFLSQKVLNKLQLTGRILVIISIILHRKLDTNKDKLTFGRFILLKILGRDIHLTFSLGSIDSKTLVSLKNFSWTNKAALTTILELETSNMLKICLQEKLSTRNLIVLDLDLHTLQTLAG